MKNDNNRGLGSADDKTREDVARQGGEARKTQGTDYSEMGKEGGQNSDGGRRDEE